MKVECVLGDITQQPDIDAIVNAANAQLRSGSGVAGAIHKAAGKELWAACKPLAPIAPGDAVITAGYQLPNPWVIHCLGPRYGVDQPEADILARCYQRALGLAEMVGLRSVAFPALSTGVFGYPLAEAAAVAAASVMAEPAVREGRLRVRFVLFDQDTLSAFQGLLARVPVGR